MIRLMNTDQGLPVILADQTNGLGRIDPISCLVTEELNGIYECEFTLLATDKHFGDMSVGGIVKVPVNEAGDEQMFRIYYISKPMNQVVEVKCQHITYDLNKVAVKPFTATGSVNAVNGLKNNILGTYPFDITTDINNTTSKFTLDIPRSFRECLGGYEGSMLDTFRGEYEYDNLTVKMLANRGSDNNVRIAYGKNLTDFQQEENIENVYTSVLGYAVVDSKTYTGSVYHKVSATYPKVKIIDFTEDYTNDAGETTSVPTTADLTTKARQYANRNSIEVPRVSISISFVPLYQTEEYKDIAPLERVSLGDTVHVYFEKLGVEASSRVVKTVWNVNLNRYDSVELGEARSNMNTVLDSVTEQVTSQATQSQGFLEQQLNEMATLIINGLGLHRTLVETEGGGYRIYLHNKETLAESDTQYIFTSEGFLVSTDYGQTWNAGFDSEGNAVLNSLATITLKALEINGGTITGSIINGATIIFGNPSGTNVTARTYNNGVRFAGSGNIFFDSSGQFRVVNSENGVERGRIYTDMDDTASMRQNGIRLVLNDENATTSDASTRSAEIDLMSQNVEASGSRANNRIELQVFDGVNGTTGSPKAFIRLHYDKDNSLSSVNIGVNRGLTDGNIRIDNDGSIYLNSNKLSFSGGYVRYT